MTELVGDDVGTLAAVDGDAANHLVEEGQLGAVVVGVEVEPLVERHRQRRAHEPARPAGRIDAQKPAARSKASTAVQ